MQMNTSEMLADYRKTGSDAAFTNLLRQFTNLVYSVAKRRLSDQSLAEEVTQTVFTRLAKSPPAINSDGELTAWLHRTTVHVAIDVWRSESRRRTREQHVALMQTLPAEDAQLWVELTPHLDEALNQLSDDERQAVLLRFYERKPMRDIGDILGVSEDAAKMRVSRAVDRLRQQLTGRGVTCTAVVLATVLMQRAVEGAPAGLLTNLIAMNLASPVVVGGLVAAIFQLLKSKAVLGAIAAVVVTVTALVLSRPAPRALEMVTVATATVPIPQSDDGPSHPLSSANVRSAVSPVPEIRDAARPMLRVIDKATGVGLAGAKIEAAYFYAGGVGEGHDFQTDADGYAPLPERKHPEKNAGANVFVRIEGYVPKVMNFHGSGTQSNFVLELESAVAAGGIVVDEQGLPVSGVELHAQRDDSDEYKSGTPNTDFQTCKVKSDAVGRWYFPFVPKSYLEIRFYLTRSNYAVTDVRLPIKEFESLNSTLVIDRGCVVAGRVTDAEGRPIAGATIKERHDFGFRKLSAKTDQDGFYSMQGVAVPNMKSVDLSDPMRPKVTPYQPEQVVNLVIQARGMAPQAHSVQLLEKTNRVNFVLAKAAVFRGRIVDESGSPIPNAVVRTDYDFEKQVSPRVEWLAHAGADGRFEWDSAPAEETCFWFEADGYKIIRSTRLLPDGTDHEIKLTRKTSATTSR